MIARIRSAIGAARLPGVFDVAGACTALDDARPVLVAAALEKAWRGGHLLRSGAGNAARYTLATKQGPSPTCAPVAICGASGQPMTGAEVVAESRRHGVEFEVRGTHVYFTKTPVAGSTHTDDVPGAVKEMLRRYEPEILLDDVSAPAECTQCGRMAQASSAFKGSNENPLPYRLCSRCL